MIDGRYLALKQRFRELDIRPFNRSVEQITGRSASYITRVLQGRSSFQPDEMRALLSYMGEPEQAAELHKYFPPLGLELEDGAFTEKVKDALIELLGQKKTASTSGGQWPKTRPERA